MNSNLKKHQQFGEVISFSTAIVHELKTLLKPNQPIEFIELIKSAQKENLLDKNVINELHILRSIRNKVAHDHSVFTEKDYLLFIHLFNKNIKILRNLNNKEVFEIALYERKGNQFGGETHYSFKEFNSKEYEDEIKNIKHSLSWYQRAIDAARIVKFIASAGVALLILIGIIQG